MYKNHTPNANVKWYIVGQCTAYEPIKIKSTGAWIVIR